MKTILVTGATSGIGEATTWKFAREGWSVIITGRRKQHLAKLTRAIQRETKAAVIALSFDVRDRASVRKAIASIAREKKSIDVLVNNAGLALGFSEIQDGDVQDWDTMIDTNIKGLLYVSEAVIPGMIKGGHGHIINLGSIAGKEVYQKGNVYCATKAAVDVLTKGMRMDLLPHGVKVSAVHPGAVDTEFSLVRFKGDSRRADSVYTGFTPLSAEDIAETIWFIATAPEHINVSDLVVLPTAQAGSGLIHRKVKS